MHTGMHEWRLSRSWVLLSRAPIPDRDNLPPCSQATKVMSRVPHERSSPTQYRSLVELLLDI